MTADSVMVRKLLRQQAAIAAFGTFALREADLAAVLNEAARVCAKGLDVRFSKICRYRAAENDLIIETGFGWKEGVIGYVVPHPDDRTPQGRAFSTGRPSICNVLLNEDAFVLPAFYAEHGIVSTIDVIIKGNGQPYGVLEIDSDEPQDYDQHDIDFLTGFANVLAEAVATSERTKVLGVTIASMTLLMKEKDLLLDQKQVLVQELQHRVRNNLQLVAGMLSSQLNETTDAFGRRGLKAITRRVFTLSQVYDQLLDTEMTRTIDFGSYLHALCTNLGDVQAPVDGSVKLQCEGDNVMLDLDIVTALGIVVVELVTNSFEHAFPDGRGQISVSLRHDAATGTATMLVADDGIGFEPVAGNKRHGVGLVGRMIEQIGGSTHVETDNGTRWTICIPVARDDDKPRALEVTA
ncbi:MAG: signal transduction histidine kinase [Sphingomonadales bacterium]|nr:signal transduction histidine kinase [Sphingomonadales bacterium]